MTQFLSCGISRIFRNAGGCFLAFSFLAGLLSGAACFLGTDPSLVSLMCGSRFDAVSIIGLCLTLALPFLLSCCSWIYDSGLIFPVCFCRAFFFSYLHGLFSVCLGPAGWLLRYGVFCSDCLSLPLLYFFWRRQLRPHGRNIPIRLLCTGLAVLIGIFDYHVIVPVIGAFLSL